LRREYRASCQRQCAQSKWVDGPRRVSARRGEEEKLPVDEELPLVEVAIVHKACGEAIDRVLGRMSAVSHDPPLAAVRRPAGPQEASDSPIAHLAQFWERQHVGDELERCDDRLISASTHLAAAA